MTRRDYVDAVERTNAELGKGNVRPCLEIHLYGTQDRSAFKKPLMAAIAAFVRRQPGALRYYRTNTMSAGKAISPDPGTMLENFLTSDEKKPAKLSGIEFTSGAKAADFELPSVAWFSTLLTPGPGKPATRSYLRISLPHDGELSDPQTLRAFARELLAEFPLVGGHCGWSFYSGGGHADAEAAIDRQLPGWLLRFPGVSVGQVLGQSSLIGAGVMTVSWLNYVSESAAKERGLELATLAALAKSKGLDQELVRPDVLEIMAGAAPETGDVNRQDLLPAYRLAGSVLTPLAMPDERAKFQTIAKMDFEAKTAWYRRFFDAA